MAKPGVIIERKVASSQRECFNRIEKAEGVSAAEFKEITSECSLTRCGRITLEPDEGALVFVPGWYFFLIFQPPVKMSKKFKPTNFMIFQIRL